MTDAISYSPAGKTVEKFHADNSFVRVVLGPVGSSKSSACCLEVFTRACEQKAHQGVRRSRWAVIRNTYPELKSTTIKTWMDWFPMAEMRWDAPITSWLRLPLPDGTRMELEVMFFPLDRPEEVGKLRSLELTGAWINEASEVAKAVFDMCTQRVGRFPRVAHGGASWNGVIMDSNFPDDDHWLYLISEKNKPEGWSVFKQPGGLIFKGGDFQDRKNYEANPEAENVPNLPSGHEYYFRQLPGKSRDWIKVFILAQYGSITDGKPIYPEWNDDIHCKKASPYPGRPLLLGFDYGLTPACVVCQVSPRGQLLVLAELFAKDMGIRQFARDVVRPFLALNFHGYSFQAAGDPAGMSRSDTDEKTCFMELAEEGIACVPAITNSFVGRREAVAKYLTRLVDGQPALLVDPGCDMIRRGFNGRYQYRRLQVVGQERYKDVPDKNEYSHCFVGATMVRTKSGDVRIDRIKVGDEVRTPLGYKRVLATMSRDTQDLRVVWAGPHDLICTPDHPFITPNGVVLADALQYNDVLIGIGTSEERQWADQQSTNIKNLTGSGITRSLTAITSAIRSAKQWSGICTALFGYTIAAPFLKAARFITRTIKRAITGLITWNCSMGESTPLITASGAVRQSQILAVSLSMQDSAQLVGMALKKVERGMPSTVSEHGKDGAQRNIDAFIAGKPILRLLERARWAFVVLHAKALLAEIQARTTRKEIASFVADRLSLTNTPRQKPALRIVGGSPYRAPSPVKVYDLTVEDAHCFYANGVLVHNCHDALQYAALHSQNMNQGSDWATKINYGKSGIV